MKYLLQAKEYDISHMNTKSSWELVWYDDKNNEITRTTEYEYEENMLKEEKK